mmetsp:Transcript_38003/g.74742  ORF Transcript_38003/g.74742 Transcript_38003/m.74742 type:complete len:242 (+) Transcript_38003:310-1035(+)
MSWTVRKCCCVFASPSCAALIKSAWDLTLSVIISTSSCLFLICVCNIALCSSSSSIIFCCCSLEVMDEIEDTCLATRAFKYISLSWFLSKLVITFTIGCADTVLLLLLLIASGDLRFLLLLLQLAALLLRPNLLWPLATLRELRKALTNTPRSSQTLSRRAVLSFCFWVECSPCSFRQSGRTSAKAEVKASVRRRLFCTTSLQTKSSIILLSAAADWKYFHHTLTHSFACSVFDRIHFAVP